MSEAFIPDDVRDFILEHIDSVAQMEALLLLREQAATEWTAVDVARRLYIGNEAAAGVLARLTLAGLCRPGPAGGCVYDPGDEARRALVDRVAGAYGRYLVAATRLIHEKPLRIQKFADAFRFRKDK